MTTTSKPASVRGHRMGWGGMLGTLLIVQMSACDSSCFLDDSGIVSGQYRYDCRATIQSNDGIRSVVTSSDLTAFRGMADDTIFAANPDSENSDRWMREYFSKYLSSVTETRATDAAFIAVYGRGPFCVTGDIRVTATDEAIESEDSRVYHPADTLELLMTCPCDACDNPEGLEGVLAVAPTDPETPLRVGFGTVPVGGMATRDVTLHNDGDGNLCLDLPAILASSAHPGDFSLAVLGGCEETPEGSVVLAPGSTCAFRATFRPSDDGPRSAEVPGARGCGEIITLAGIGGASRLSASPAPACLLPTDPPGPCRERSIRIDNALGSGVNLTGIAMSNSALGWEDPRLEDASGTVVDLTIEPFFLGPGDFATAIVRACDGVTADNTLLVTHDGADYGEPGSPTGDVDSGSPLAVRTSSPTSGCTP
jgi:hypothetical protein